MEIIFWLNPNTGVVYHKTYRDTMFRIVGEENQYGHIIIAISVIKNKKLICYNNGLDLLRGRIEPKKTIKNTILSKIIDFLTKLNER